MSINSQGSLYAAGSNSTVVHYVLQNGYCNTRCMHCYVLSQNQKQRKRDCQVARRDIGRLLGQGYKVNFRGTEILLDPEFLELFPLVGQDYIQTNGIELDKNSGLFEILKKVDIKKIIFTYPSLPENLLGFKKEIVERVVKLSNQHGFRTILDYIVTSEVVSSLKQDGGFFKKLVNRLVSIGADELRFVRLIPFSDGLKSLAPSVNDMELVTAKSVRLEAQYKNSLDVTRAGQFGLYDLRRTLKEKFLGIKVPPPEESGIMDCAAGKKLFIIDVDNSVYPCLYLMSKDFKMGEFRNGVIEIDKPKISPSEIHLADCPVASIQNKRIKFREP